MFTKPRWLRPGGRFHEVWRLAHGYDIDRGQLSRVDLRDVCWDFQSAVTSESGAESQRASLRLLSQLSSGMVRLYSHKLDHFVTDVSEINRGQQRKLKRYTVVSDDDSEASQPTSEHSSSTRCQYPESSESLDCDMESSSGVPRVNPTSHHKGSESLPTRILDCYETEYYFSSSPKYPPTVDIESMRKTTALKAAELIPQAVQHRPTDSEAFEEPNPPVVKAGKSGKIFSSDSPTLPGHDTEKILQTYEDGRKKRKINFQQETHESDIQPGLPQLDLLISECDDIEHLEPREEVRPLSPILKCKKRKYISIPDYVELEVVRKQRRISRNFPEFESLHHSLDSDATVLIPRQDPIHMEIIPELSLEDLTSPRNTVVPAGSRNDPAVIQLTSEELGELEPIEEDFTSQKVKKIRKVQLIRTPRLPSLESHLENLERRRVLFDISHSKPTAKRIEQMYYRNMVTLPRETDREMLLMPVSSTPEHVMVAFVPPSISSIAETLEEAGPSNIRGRSICESIESTSEPQFQDRILSVTIENETVRPLRTSPVADAVINMGRERYWLRSDEAERLRKSSLPQQNVGKESRSSLPQNEKATKNKTRGPRRVSLPEINGKARKTRSSSNKNVKVQERRVGRPTPKSQKSIPDLSKLKSFISGIKSLSPMRRISNTDLSISPVIALGRLENIPPMQSRERKTSSRRSNDDSPTAGPSGIQQHSNDKMSHHRESTASNSPQTSGGSKERSLEESGKPSDRYAIILICPRNTITEENSVGMEMMITPLSQVDERIQEFQDCHRRDL